MSWHEAMMRRALAEAERALGRTSPNPAVGAVLVRGRRVVGAGFTAPPGGPHAEVKALRAAGAWARGADLYTTLEPCDHFGRTPPCTRAILAAGVRRVFCATLDPNPRVDGKGVRRLRQGGVKVEVGLLAAEAEALNRPFFQVMRTRLPWVTLKVAATLDGKLAAAGGDSKWVTGEAARARVHALRDRVDAILVGAGTVAADDPRLTARPAGRRGRNPARIVLDSRLSLPVTRRVFDVSAARTIVATLAAAGSVKARRLAARGVEVWTLPAAGGRVDLRALLRRLAREDLQHLLVEGGATVHAALLRQRLAREAWVFLAPKLLGEEGRSWVGPLGVKRMSGAPRLRVEAVERLGEDLLVRALL